MAEQREKERAERETKERVEREERERVERDRKELVASRGGVRGVRGTRASSRGITRGTTTRGCTSYLLKSFFIYSCFLSYYFTGRYYWNVIYSRVWFGSWNSKTKLKLVATSLRITRSRSRTPVGL